MASIFDGTNGSIHSKRSQRKTTTYKGRGQPCTQQAVIAATVDFPRTEFEDRRAMMPATGLKRSFATVDSNAAYEKESKVYAPLGDPLCFQAMQGELAIAPVDDYGVTERNILSIDCQLSVTTTVNGWSTERDAMCAGVVRNARPLSSTDSKGTIVAVGTQTIINTGPYEIMPGDDVYFSLTPFTVFENGVMLNAIEIDEVGQPGFGGAVNADGELAAKFKPATYPMRDNSIYAYLRRGELFIEQAVAQKVLSAGGNYDRITKRNLEDVLAEVTATYRDAPDNPAYEYFRMCIGQNFMYAMDFASTLNEVIEEFVGSYFSSCAAKRKKFIQANGRTPTAESEIRPYKKAKTVAGDENTQYRVAELVQGSVQLLKLISRAKLELVVEVHNYFRRRLIGKCIKGNCPGAGMDIALGFGHKA
jgi:hypothetical protein